MEIILDKESWPKKLGINLGWDLDLITDKARELEFPAKLSTSSNQLLSIIFIWYRSLEYIQSRCNWAPQGGRSVNGFYGRSLIHEFNLTFSIYSNRFLSMNHDLPKRLIWWAFTLYTNCLKFSFQRSVGEYFMFLNSILSWKV